MTALKDFLQNSLPSAPPAPQQPGFFSKAGNIAKNIGNAIIQPFAKVAGSGVRAIEAIPSEVKGLGQAATSPNLGYSLAHPLEPVLNAPGLNQAEQIQKQPIFGQPTIQGSTIPQNLGTATQVGSFAVGGELGPVAQGALIGTAQGAGNYAANSSNPNLKGLALSTGVGAAIGGGIGAVSQYVPEALQAMRGSKIAAAQATLDTAGENAVNSANSLAENVLGDQSRAGQSFAQGATNLASNPNLKVPLTSNQLDQLNNLRESAKFALPSYVDSSGTEATLGGKPINLGTMNPKVAQQIGAAGQETAKSLDPVQAQDLIRRLNKLTFAAKASGDLAVNQQTIGLTNEIKSAASQAFGPEWDKLYTNYSTTKGAMESIDDIININPNATASELEKSAQTIQKLSQSPTGKVFLKQVAQNYEQTTGTNLTERIGTIQKLLDAQEALKKAQQPGLIEKVFSPTYLGRSAVRYAVIYGGLKSLQNALQGK